MIPSRTWRRPGGSRASLCSQQDKPPAPHPTTAPSRVTLGDKGMALGDACATPELALREISAWWDSSTAPSPRHQTLLRVWDRLRWSLRQRCPFTVPRWQRGRWHCHCGVPRGTAGRERDIGHQVTSAVTAQPSTPSRGTCSAPQLSLSPSCPHPVPKEMFPRSRGQTHPRQDGCEFQQCPLVLQLPPGWGSQASLSAIRADFPSFILAGICSFSEQPSEGRVSSQNPI